MDFANNFSTEHLQLDTSDLLEQHVVSEIVTHTATSATPRR